MRWGPGMPHLRLEPQKAQLSSQWRAHLTVVPALERHLTHATRGPATHEHLVVQPASRLEHHLRSGPPRLHSAIARQHIDDSAGTQPAMLAQLGVNGCRRMPAGTPGTSPPAADMQLRLARRQDTADAYQMITMQKEEASPGTLSRSVTLSKSHDSNGMLSLPAHRTPKS